MKYIFFFLLMTVPLGMETCTPRLALAVDVTISWTDNSSGTTQEDFWELQKAPTEGGTYVGFASAGQDAESYTFAPGAEGTTEWYRIRGVNAIGNGAFSTPVSFTVPVPPPVVIDLCGPPPGRAAIPNLVLAMSMNENSGATVSDSSGQANHGTITEATWTASGKYGAALTFDGLNDWVTVADAPSLHLTTGITMSAWIFPTALNGGTSNGWRTVASKESSPANSYEFYANSSTPVPRGYISVGGEYRSVAGTIQLSLNVWSHLAFTYDGVNLRLYVDGAQVGVTAATGTALVGTGPLRIGGNLTWSEFFAGRIDELRIYDRALTPTEIVTDRDTPIS
jgi:hypothetical protein